MTVASPPRDLFAWLDGDGEPHAVLAIAGDGAKASAYLLTEVAKTKRQFEGGMVETLNGPPKWHQAAEIESLKSARWP